MTALAARKWRRLHPRQHRHSALLLVRRQELPGRPALRSAVRAYDPEGPSRPHDLPPMAVGIPLHAPSPLRSQVVEVAPPAFGFLLSLSRTEPARAHLRSSSRSYAPAAHVALD